MKKQFIFGVMLLSLTGCNLLEDMKSFNNTLDNVVAVSKGESINITTTNNNVINDELKNYFRDCNRRDNKYWSCSKDIYYKKYPSDFVEYDDDGNRHGANLCFKVSGERGRSKKIEGVYMCISGSTLISTYNKLYDEQGNKLKDADQKYNNEMFLKRNAKILYVLPDKINYPDVTPLFK